MVSRLILLYEKQGAVTHVSTTYLEKNKNKGVYAPPILDKCIGQGIASIHF